MKPLRHIMLTGLVCAFGGLSAFTLSACSDDEVFGDDGDQEVELSVDESDLSPGRVSVDAGEIEFVVHNDGERLHSFAVRTPDGVERSENMKPGETARLTVTLGAGSYRMYDPRGGYRLRGVSGRVDVTSDRDDDTVTERTVERTVEDDDVDVDVDVPEVDDPEIQEPEVQEPPARPAPQPPPPPVVTQTVPAPPPPPAEDTSTTP